MATFRLTLTLLLCFFVQSAYSMDVTLEREEDIQFILMSGRIAPGDAERLAKVAIDFARKSGYPLKAFRVDSAGGDVNEAIRIATIVRGLYGSVKVVNNRYCASSCFLIWLNGAVRIASGSDVKSDGGVLVVHRPYFVDERMNDPDAVALGQRQLEAMKATRSYLEDNLVPRTLIDEMLSRPSNDGYSLRQNDIIMLGAIPPWFEEVSIARCNFRRGLVDEIVAETIRGRPAEAQRLRLLDENIIQCQHQIRDVASTSYLNKLSTGWRPWKVK
jgi:hypothetical protein